MPDATQSATTRRQAAWRPFTSSANSGSTSRLASAGFRSYAFLMRSRNCVEREREGDAGSKENRE